VVEKRAIKFERLRVTGYDRNTDLFDFKLYISVNDVPQKLKKQYKISKPEDLKEQLIDEVKEEFGNTQFAESDDILENILVVMIDDFEKVEERLTMFFKKLKDKSREFKNNKRAEGYINEYNSMADIELTF